MELSSAAERQNFTARPRYDATAGVLIGSECADCGLRSWPGRGICNRCGSPRLEQVALAPAGSLQTYTTVHVARPGLAAPYLLGQVRLDDGVRVHAHLRGLAADAHVPLRVRLAFAADLETVPPFHFEPE
ncbi:MAG: OB-fold domain-containing protein [Actinobacteria bacterium]|nr:OB-fold domain-containing protein [Actinomycetota bacterium]